MLGKEMGVRSLMEAATHGIFQASNTLSFGIRDHACEQRAPKNEALTHTQVNECVIRLDTIVMSSYLRMKIVQ